MKSPRVLKYLRASRNLLSYVSYENPCTYSGMICNDMAKYFQLPTQSLIAFI